MKQAQDFVLQRFVVQCLTLQMFQINGPLDRSIGCWGHGAFRVWFHSEHYNKFYAARPGR